MQKKLFKSFDQDSSYWFNTGGTVALTQIILHKFYEDF
jgi:hypothetical protein